MKNNLLAKIWPHLIAVVTFLVISYAYFYPQLSGQSLIQHDNQQYQGMSKEINDFRVKTGEEALWTNSMFGGMPAYLISTAYKTNLIRYVEQVIQIGQRPASYIFVAMLGFYILLLAFGVNPWLALVGAVAYGFSSYFFIILQAGHNSKMVALSYLAPMIAGIWLAYRNKLLLGGALAGLFLGLEINAGHLQITYYGAIVVLFLLGYIVVETIKEKTWTKFLKGSAVLMVAAALAVGANFSSLWFTYDYGKDSIRGKSELTHNQANQTSGLDKDYATAWSYGKMETFNLFIPNLMGGSSMSGVGTSGELYKALNANSVPNATQLAEQVPAYWGPQPMTSGPVYLGAIVVFLFIFGLFYLKGSLRWWMLGATFLAIMLAWGKNFPGLTDFFLNYIPGYNKFRTVSMILIIAQFVVPFIGFLALKPLFEDNFDRKKFLEAFTWSVIVTSSIALLFILFGGMVFDFSSPIEAQWPRQMADALRSDRAAMLKADAFRSLAYVLMAAGLLLAFVYKKVNIKLFVMGLLALILMDMWTVNHRYISSKDFAMKSQVAIPFPKSAANEQILKDTDPNYRVYNVSVSPFNDASTSYFHKSIGGYHGAKMRRYQELIDRQIGNGNMAVLNMLNTRYFIIQGQTEPEVRYNADALGNAWFVDKIQLVDNADQEIDALTSFNPKSLAIVDKRFEQQLTVKSFNPDTTAKIALLEYAPNKLVYSYTTSAPRVAIFSEIFYDKGWNATIDGKSAPYFRANYVLRGMMLPEGTHKVEFQFKPAMYEVGKNIDLASSLLLILAALGALGVELFRFVKKVE
ncbi:YfhO family protein [Williamwhitmania taraxaci]|uniref:Membrane protein YfhO n=1 Tax=Williamwhitmania taraxaci TaxID=1640674 RepID=A0A1G6NZ85_9BACT|nr:YfhO family protein [Williamwhitmania taraxaci]SDC73099.1 membrane protein YfhO [Williamwhitmania taraxaci]